MLVKKAFGSVKRFARFARVVFFLYMRLQLPLDGEVFIAKMAIDITMRLFPMRAEVDYVQVVHVVSAIFAYVMLG